VATRLETAPPPPALWRNPEFLKLWLGRTVSSIGSQVSGLAIPLTAASVLSATPAQMGLLLAARTAPPLILGLVVGVWIDRVRRRPVLVAADLGRALLLGSIPVLAAAGALRMEHLIAVSLLAAVLTLCFDVAATSFVPTFIPRAQLVDGNSKLTASGSAAQVVGPSLGGALIAVLTAPVAVAADAVTYVFSAVCNILLRARDPDPDDPQNLPRPAAQSAPAGAPLWRELGAEVMEGIRVVAGNAYMRTCAGTAGIFNFFAGIALAVYVLYVTRELQLSAPVLGVLYTIGGVGSVIGAGVAAPLVQRAGFGVATALAAGVVGVAWLPAALAGGAAAFTLPLLALSHFLRGVAQTVYGINATSLRQAAVPDHLQGRVSGTLRVIFLGTAPLGSLAGGFLGERIGLWPTLAIGATGAVLGALWLVLSPVRALRTLPLAGEELSAAP
jgi:MFS family permease